MFIMDQYEYINKFTAAYQTRDDDVFAREARCLEVMAEALFLPPESDDLLCGRVRIAELGFSPEPLLGRSVAYYYDERRLNELRAALQPDKQARLDELLEFWRKEETRWQIRAQYPVYMREALPEDIYWEHSQIAFPLYRVVDAYLDYEKLISLGINGLRTEIASQLGGPLFAAMDSALETLQKLCRRYAQFCRNDGRETLSAVMENIAYKAPQTFYEAAQLCYIYAVSAGVLNYGRLDDLLGAFIKEGEEEQALTIIKSLWRLIASRESVFHGRVVIGGKGRKNEAAADRFALLAIEASRQTALIEPQLSLRFYKGQNPALMEAALNCIGEGRTYPILYNDDVNIPSVSRAFGFSEAEAEHYMMYGCGEYVLNHAAFGSPNGVINLLKILEVTLSGGVDLFEEKPLGLKSGGITAFTDFEELYAEFLRQARYFIEILAQQEWLEYRICSETAGFLYLTALFDDCLKRGKPIFGGGARYLGGALETYGNVNAVNSLYAIKKAIYDDKAMTAHDLLCALKSDFAGYDALRRKLIDAEKFGNDADDVDSFARRFHADICGITREQKNNTPLDYYLVVIINNEANTILGRFTAASADGRGRGKPMANGNAPFGSTERNGLSAMLNSMVKIDTDVHAGAVQNIMMSSELFNGRRDLASAALEVYWEKGGAQAMITVVGKGDLEKAIKEPGKYSSLMVRVGGFSARFITLAPDVQREIASRMLF
jgi:pyruvate-formate lyase